MDGRSDGEQGNGAIAIEQRRPEQLGDPAAAEEASRHYRGWIVVAGCFLTALFTWGYGFYGHGVFLAEFQKAFGWPAASISFASTCYYFLSAILVIYTSDMIRKFGPSLVVAGGVASLSLSLIVLAYASSLWELFAAYFIMAFAWAAMTIAAISTILGLWFRQLRGMAISLALNGASFGGIIVTPILIAATANFGLRTALTGGAIVTAAIMLPVALMWLNPPLLRPSAESESPSSARPEWTRARALQDPLFLSLAGAFALALLAQVGFLVHQVSFLEPAIGQYQAGVGVAITTAMAITGRLTLGLFIDRLNARGVTTALLLAQALSLFVMATTSNTIAIFGATAVFGLAVGNLITLPSILVHREFPPASFGMLVALATAISQFTYAFGPAVLGLLRDLSGSYALPLYFCMISELTAAALIAAVRKIHKA
jgi:predicted MFS family arabinose efflux permease